MSAPLLIQQASAPLSPASSAPIGQPTFDSFVEDASRISFYLNCCVMGCGLAVDRIPQELLDYTNCHRLPLEWQNTLFALAFESFSLQNLLNRSIFIDDFNQVLPAGCNRTIVSIESANDIFLLQQLSGQATSPSLLSGKVLICSSAWLKEFYVLPYRRQMVMPLTHQQQQPHQQPIVVDQSSTKQSVSSTNDSKRDIHDESMETIDHHECDSVVDIPMVAAVPIVEANTVENDVVGTSLIVPGHEVRLFGLASKEMNGKLAVVQERHNNRVIVQVENHECKYSVRLENLAIIVHDEICEAVAC